MTKPFKLTRPIVREHPLQKQIADTLKIVLEMLPPRRRALPCRGYGNRAAHATASGEAGQRSLSLANPPTDGLL